MSSPSACPRNLPVYLALWTAAGRASGDSGGGGGGSRAVAGGGMGAAGCVWELHGPLPPRPSVLGLPRCRQRPRGRGGRRAGLEPWRRLRERMGGSSDERVDSERTDPSDEGDANGVKGLVKCEGRKRCPRGGVRGEQSPCFPGLKNAKWKRTSIHMRRFTSCARVHSKGLP